MIPAAPKYSVVGADSQVVEIQLQPGESIKAEPGVMMHMHPETEMKMEMQPMCGCKSICAGESCCKVNYTNKGGAPQYIGLTPINYVLSDHISQCHYRVDHNKGYIFRWNPYML